jgi:hypothetical protein
LFDAMVENEEAIRLDAAYNQAFAAVLNRKGKGEYRNRLERARQAAEDYLAHFPPAQQGAILCGALVSVYSSERVGSDAAVWLMASNEEQGERQPGAARRAMDGLRAIGLLNEMMTTRAGLVTYFAGFEADGLERRAERDSRTVGPI